MSYSDIELSNRPRPSFFQALMPIVITLAMIATQLFVFQNDAPHIPLFLGIVVTAAFSLLRGYRWHELERGAFQVLHSALPMIIVLYLIGMIIAVWIQSGTVPLLIYYGIKFLSPDLFLPIACIACSFASIATGTSWGTTGTLGIALIGIGDTLGVPAYLTAGAVVSGAFFGDKISPLSDTTVFASTLVNTDLFGHIRNMLPVTVPAMLIAIIAYYFLGMEYSSTSGPSASGTLAVLEETFYLTNWLLLPAFIVAFLAVKRVPALPGLFGAVFAGGIVALIFQDVSLTEISHALLNGPEIETGDPSIDALLAKGGMLSMSWTVSLAIIALTFSGMLEYTRCLEVILDSIVRFATNQRRLMLSSLSSILGLHVATGDIFSTMALSGRTYAPAFRGLNLSPRNLSRNLEDAGTLAAPLIPWAAGGAFVTSTLGVSTWAYMAFAIACWMSLLIDVLYSYTGWFVPNAAEEERKKWQEDGDAVLTHSKATKGSNKSKLLK